MISIIICSINPGQCEKTVKSINETIGAGYETIVFDNREKNWGICKVYNHCAEKAKHPYLCFAHEDVIIDVKDWGKEFIEFTERTPDCGVIGFAGGLQARRNFSCWWSGEKRMNVYDGFTGVKGNDLKSQYPRRHYSNPFEEKYSQALCIDGLFLFVRKEIWKEIKYDEINFQRFHFYDADFTFSAAQRYKNFVYLNGDVYHYSAGKVNKDFCGSMLAFQKKWKYRLPCTLYKENRLKKNNVRILGIF